MDAPELAKKIRELRKAAALTQEDLAARAGVARRAIQRIEKAEGSPNLATLSAIGRVLNTEFGPVPSGSRPTSRMIVDISPDELVEKIIAATQPRLSLEDREFRAAWASAADEPWRRGFALFFLTGDQRHLKDVSPDVRKKLLAGLQFHGMPAAKAPAQKK